MSGREQDAFEDGQTFQVREGQELTQVPDGYVIYQSETERVHYLNPTAAIVYELCGDRYSVEQISAFLRQAFALEGDPAPMVRDCLSSLMAEGLIGPCERS